MKILIAQTNPTIGDLKGNAKTITTALQHARNVSADIVVFPELSISGYPPEDLLLIPTFIRDIEEQLHHIVDESHNLVAIVGTVREDQQKKLFNTAAIIQNGTVIGFQDKTILPNYDVFNEQRYFSQAKDNTIWELLGRRVAITICEDIWHPNKEPIFSLKDQSPDIIINISASPFSANKPRIRQKVCSETATIMGCPMVLCNQVGANDSLIFDGNSLYSDAHGTIIQQAKSFEEDLMLIDTKDTTPQSISFDPLEEIYKALVLGVRDYFRKQGLKKACLGLSGGIDSALVACIAVDALGSDNIVLLLMPSRFSTSEGMSDAKSLVKILGSDYNIISIEKPFQTYLDLLTPYFEGKKHDTTEENLQARIRGMILMAFSNKHGHIVLNTGNKSEMAMGYSTLYGDMCGGLGVISDVSKTQVYALSRWLNKDYERIPQRIIDKPPSAELRADQKDSDSLPDYDIVDAVLEEYIGEHCSPEIIASKHKIPLDIVKDLIKKIHDNEYKRRQAPPGLRIALKAFSKGRIFPIVQRWV